MGKISPVSAKYIIHASIEIDGVVDRPDVIGAVFGQTEGLLGNELELRELQRSGRIGRIEVDSETRGGKTKGTIIIPSSLDKAETAIVGAALEIIQRIGPCNAKLHIVSIEDVRVSKRKFVIERAKELLKKLIDDVMPDSQELSDEVAYSVRVMEIQEYGKERLPAGPAVDDSDEVIIVEGRADVLNLLKHGIKNSIAINGTSVPPEIADLSKKKVLNVFVDGDRGGNLIVQELMAVAEIDYVSKAPDGKEVEELTKKEIHKSLRSKISSEQFKLELSNMKAIHDNKKKNPNKNLRRPSSNKSNGVVKPGEKRNKPVQKNISNDQMVLLGKMLEDLIGTRGAYILDNQIKILGKVPISELQSTIKSLKTGIFAIVFDGIIEKDLVNVAERANVKFLVAMDSKVKNSQSRVNLLTADSF